MRLCKLTSSDYLFFFGVEKNIFPDNSCTKMSPPFSFPQAVTLCGNYWGCEHVHVHVSVSVSP